MAFDVAKKRKKASLNSLIPASKEIDVFLLSIHYIHLCIRLFINTFLLRTYCVPDIILGAVIMFLELGVVTHRQVFI